MTRSERNELQWQGYSAFFNAQARWRRLEAHEARAARLRSRERTLRRILIVTLIGIGICLAALKGQAIEAERYTHDQLQLQGLFDDALR